MAADRDPTCEHQHATGSGSAGAWTEIGTLSVLAAFLGYSFFSGRLVRFLVWPYVWLPPAAAVILLAMGAARLVAHLRGKASCGCQTGGGSQGWRFACAATLLVPVIVALGVNPTRFSAEGARKRARPAAARDVELRQAINWVLGAKTAGKKLASGQAVLPKEPTILDLLTAAEDYLPHQIEGQFVTVLGQCDLPEGAESERFDLYRLVVTCCIADATAVSIEVSRTPGVKLESGGWVRVAGRIKFDHPLDSTLPVIHAVGPVAKIPEPPQPYL